MNTTDTAQRPPDSPASVLPPAGVVAAIYEAFGRGDIPGVLDLCAEDVVLDDDSLPSAAQKAGHPLLVAHRGKEGVAEFFAAVAECEITRFEVLDLMVSSAPSGPQQLVNVVAKIRIDLISPAGILVDDDELHLWGIGADGMAHTMRHYCDTAKHIASMGVTTA
jgi:ketosteroid isomerase-like protein